MRWLLLALIGVAMAGCDRPAEQKDKYVRLEMGTREELPQAPHVKRIRARPTDAMALESTATPLQFRVLQKRTLEVRPLDVKVGDAVAGPWGGRLLATAFVPDLLIKEGQALHGPEGHVNPAVWVILSDAAGEPIHEGWLFARDPAISAWDHPRFDLTFLGPAGAGAAAKLD